jgi:adenosylhomocysteine nucleosidase
MKKIGMVVAVEMQAVYDFYGQPDQVVKDAPFETVIYKKPEYELVVAVSHAGEIRASATTQYLITEHKVDLIVNFGLVGGLTKDIAVVDLCVVEKIVHYDFDTSEYEDTSVGRYECFPDIYIPTTKEYVDKLTTLVPSIKRVTCASGDKFIDDHEKKANMHKMFNADICEMEAAAIGMVCYINKTPFIMIKCVSDSLFGGSKEFNKEFKRASDKAIEIVDLFIKNI